MHMQSNNDGKKYRFFDPFTGEAPLNVAKFATSVWRFSPHCVVKFTIVYSTNLKNSMEVDSVVIISILSMTYITTRIVKT